MGQVYEMQNAPTAAEYVRALTALDSRVTERHKTMFRVHYEASDRTATTKQIAAWSGAAGWGDVNLRYGELAHAVCDELGIRPDLRPNDKYRWWSVWSRGWQTRSGFVWQMLPNVAAALEQLGWVAIPAAGFVSPDEVTDAALFTEGAVRQVTVNAYERDQKARSRCIMAHGSHCCICGFSFGAEYGPEADGYIHVHHVRPLSEIGRAYMVDPVEDLRPVCPNCHAVLHLGGLCRSIDEVRQLRAQQRQA